MLRLFDTAQGAVVPFRTRRDGEVSMYICGPTVYGPPHLGHGRFALVFDVLRRYLEWSGLQVTYVSNITDIDDKIIERGRSESRDPAEIAVRCERVWWDAMERIGVKTPTHSPHATAYVEGMVELVGQLIERGAAYETDDGVYLDTSTVDGYGLLARQSLESLQAGARVEAEPAKRSPHDFVLWKKRAGTGEPTWPSPWGDGRPGWHTECVVMSLDLLGDGFDLHGGGQDLAFPHHENERAQAVALSRDFARHWLHNGFVEVGGEKMSKSLGNFTNLLDLTDRHDARAYRLLVLRSHYRSPVEVTATTVADAERQLDRLDAFARRTAELPAAVADEAAVAEFRRLMDDDLNTPAALAVVSQLVTRANQALDIEDDEGAAPLAAAVRELCGAVGLVLHGVAAEGPDGQALALLAQRSEAKAARDFATADRLRDELRSRGWLVEDTAKGPLLRRG